MGWPRSVCETLGLGPCSPGCWPWYWSYCCWKLIVAVDQVVMIGYWLRRRLRVLRVSMIADRGRLYNLRKERSLARRIGAEFGDGQGVGEGRENALGCTYH